MMGWEKREQDWTRVLERMRVFPRSEWGLMSKIMPEQQTIKVFEEFLDLKR